MIMQSQELFDLLAGVLPLGGIALSWWSFRFAEEGATPDAWPSLGTGFDFEQESLEKGLRHRARWSARVLFAAGALLLAAGVPMGSAGMHVQNQVNFPAIGAFAIVTLAILYGAVEASKIWRARRKDAFWLYYNKDMFFLYDEKKTAEIYYALNPMPFWSLPNRNWFASVKVPDIDVVARRAPKTQASGSQTVSLP
jgi:hypothetical protein